MMIYFLLFAALIYFLPNDFSVPGNCISLPSPSFLRSLLSGDGEEQREKRNGNVFWHRIQFHNDCRLYLIASTKIEDSANCLLACQSREKGSDTRIIIGDRFLNFGVFWVWVGGSVTRWLDNLLKIWPLTSMKISPVE